MNYAINVRQWVFRGILILVCSILVYIYYGTIVEFIRGIWPDIIPKFLCDFILLLILFASIFLGASAAVILIRLLWHFRLKSFIIRTIARFRKWRSDRRKTRK